MEYRRRSIAVARGRIRGPCRPDQRVGGRRINLFHPRDRNTRQTRIIFRTSCNNCDKRTWGRRHRTWGSIRPGTAPDNQRQPDRHQHEPCRLHSCCQRPSGGRPLHSDRACRLLQGRRWQALGSRGSDIRGQQRRDHRHLRHHRSRQLRSGRILQPAGSPRGPSRRRSVHHAPRQHRKESLRKINVAI